MVAATSRGSVPNERVKDPWGSPSIASTRCPFPARAAAKLAVLVVFPTPLLLRYRDRMQVDLLVIALPQQHISSGFTSDWTTDRLSTLKHSCQTKTRGTDLSVKKASLQCGRKEAGGATAGSHLDLRRD